MDRPSSVAPKDGAVRAWPTRQPAKRQPSSRLVASPGLFQRQSHAGRPEPTGGSRIHQSGYPEPKNNSFQLRERVWVSPFPSLQSGPQDNCPGPSHGSVETPEYTHRRPDHSKKSPIGPVTSSHCRPTAGYWLTSERGRRPFAGGMCAVAPTRHLPPKPTGCCFLQTDAIVASVSARQYD